jgi:hypothetical protein
VGALWAHRLPAYLDKWHAPYTLGAGWEHICRSSGGLDQMLGIICHHDAIGPQAGEDTWRSSIPPRFGGNRSDGPVGNGCLDHHGVFRFWAAGAANTAGVGGPMLSTRGVVPRDGANRTTFNIEARNNGVGEPWTAAQVKSYPRLCAAILDWANHETPGAALRAGDIWSHALIGPGWTNRKIDPAGPSPWGSGPHTWNMNAFRGAVFAVQMAGPHPGPTPPPAPPPSPPPPLPPAPPPRPPGPTHILEDSVPLRAAKNKDTGNTFVLGDGVTAHTLDGLDGTEIALRVSGGVIDVATRRIVYSWNDVTPISRAAVTKYVGRY